MLYSLTNFYTILYSHNFVPQSDVAEAIVKPEEKVDRNQTIRFSTPLPKEMNYIVPSGEDITRSSRMLNDVALADFLARPIKIAESVWVPGGASLTQTFNPWSIFLQNKRVANRISNFNLFRCNLKVKFVINGNGFYFGRVLAAYLPHSGLDELSQFDVNVPAHFIQLSQLPHVYIDPTTSTGGTLTLPFMYWMDFVSIPNDEFQFLGEIYMRALNDLQHANGDTKEITITTYAWAEDVEMGVPTATDSIALQPQAGVRKPMKTETDEANAKGVVSGPATSVASLASKLKTVPYLSPYATATEMGANMVAGLAKLMGYSRPNTTYAPYMYQPSNTASMALCTVPDRAEKLTVDDKQALGMGQEIAGIKSEDPMSILNIAMRESYLTTFTWNPDTNADQLLWNGLVMPTQHATFADTKWTPNQVAYCYPACAVASLPFDYWVGTLNFRFQVVCSAFHKGRLRFVYDPNLLPASIEYNVNYSEVLDLSEKQEITMSISHSQNPGILRVVDENPSNTYGPTLLTSSVECNGVIGVYVLNELSTPNTVLGQEVEVNVFISAGEDFKVFSPNNYIQNFGFVPQSEVAAPMHPDDAVASDPVSDDKDPLTGPADINDLITSVYVGECIGSFRQLLKRYTGHSAIFNYAGAGLQTNYSRRNSFPYLSGYMPSDTIGKDVTSTGDFYNYATTPMLQYIAMAFAGWRGSIRHKVIPMFYDKRDYPLSLSAYRSADNGYNNYTQPWSNQASTSKMRRNAIDVLDGPSIATPYGFSGMTYITNTVNDMISFEIPYQYPQRYSYSKTIDWTSGNGECNGFVVTVTGEASALTASKWYVAAGEDFQVYFWTGMPPMFYTDSLPLAG